MNSAKHYETRFAVNKDPQTVFNSIIDTRKRWNGDIEGDTRQLGESNGRSSKPRITSKTRRNGLDLALVARRAVRQRG